MVLFLLNFLFSALTTLSNLASWLILTTTAYLLVLVIWAFKVPGEAIKVVLEQLSDAIKSCAEHLMGLLLESISTLFSTLFDLLKEGIANSAAATGSAIGAIMEQTRDSLDALVKDIPEVLTGFSEMVSTIVTDLWNNCQEAFGYVTENA